MDGGTEDRVVHWCSSGGGANLLQVERERSTMGLHANMDTQVNVVGYTYIVCHSHSI